MKGLWIKDFKLLKKQVRLFAVILIMGIAITFATDTLTFTVGYLNFIIPFVALSTISYDEYDNGNAFLFSLPISRKGYVLEKYGFAISLCLIAMVLTLLLSLGYGAVRGMEGIIGALVSSPAVFMVVLYFVALMIPLQLRFGAEKGRIAMLIAVGFLFGCGYVLNKLLTVFDTDLLHLLEQTGEQHPLLLLLGLFGLTATVLLLSLTVSIRIMNKKEF